MATIGLCVFVLTPGDMLFALDVQTLDRDLSSAQADDRLAHLELASRLHAVRADNQSVVGMLDASFRAASIALVIDLVLWIAALTVG